MADPDPMTSTGEPLTTIIKRAISDPGSVRPRDFASLPEWQMLAGPVTVIHYRAGCACGWSLTYTTQENAERAVQGHIAVARHLERLKADRD